MVAGPVVVEKDDVGVNVKERCVGALNKNDGDELCRIQ